MFESLLSRSGLSYDRLKNFLLVVDAGSIVKACAGDPVRQSLFSRQIRELEEFFSTQLTQRQGKGIAISPAGQRLALLIRDHFQGLQDFQQDQLNLPKQFTFGAGASILDWLLIPTANELAQHLGDASLRFENHRSLAAVEAVREGSLDFAIVRQDAIPSSAPQTMLGRVTFWMCIGHQLLKRNSNPAITSRLPSNWHQLPLALPVEGGSFHASLHQSCASAGISLKPTVQCQSFLQMKQLVASGTHASILPSLGLQGLPESNATIVPFPPLKNFGRHLCLHWNTRQMARRGLEPPQISALAMSLKHRFKPFNITNHANRN